MSDTENAAGNMSPELTCSPLDDLCVQMLQLGAFAEGTGNMRASEIKALLVPFFGAERVDRCVGVVCGKANKEVSGK
jgi:hypothetical protein